MKLKWRPLKIEDDVRSFEPAPFDITFRPTIKIMPQMVSAVGSTLVERATSIVPIVRETPPYGARATFSFYPMAPHLDRIVIPPGVNQTEEIITLAHELGHAENSRFERDRWAKIIPEIIRWRVENRRPENVNLLIEEEVRANARGRVHVKELHPDFLPLYDHEMEWALVSMKSQLGNLPL